MNNPYQHLVAALEDIARQPERPGDMEHIDRICDKIVAEVNKLKKAESIGAGIEEYQQISLADVAALEKLYPGIIYHNAMADANFTTAPSNNGVVAALEAINWKSVGKWGIIGAIIGAILLIISRALGKGDQPGMGANAQKALNNLDKATQQSANAQSAASAAQPAAVENLHKEYANDKNAKNVMSKRERIEDIISHSKEPINQQTKESAFVANKTRAFARLTEYCKGPSINIAESAIFKSGHWTQQYITENKIAADMVFSFDATAKIKASFLWGSDTRIMNEIDDFIKKTEANAKGGNNNVAKMVEVGTRVINAGTAIATELSSWNKLLSRGDAITQSEFGGMRARCLKLMEDLKEAGVDLVGDKVTNPDPEDLENVKKYINDLCEAILPESEDKRIALARQRERVHAPTIDTTKWLGKLDGIVDIEELFRTKFKELERLQQRLVKMSNSDNSLTSASVDVYLHNVKSAGGDMAMANDIARYIKEMQTELNKSMTWMQDGFLSLRTMLAGLHKVMSTFTMAVTHTWNHESQCAAIYDLYRKFLEVKA